MAVASKAARQSSVAKAARKPAAAKKAAAKAAAAAKTSKSAREAREAFVAAAATRSEQGRIIQAEMSKSLQTVEQLASKLGMTAQRVDAHFQYELGKGRAKLNSRKQIVVLSQPVRRNAG